MKSRVTVTRRHTGRIYVGMDVEAFRALVAMLRCAKASAWQIDCMGVVQPVQTVLAGDRLFKAVKDFEESSQETL